MQIWEYVGFIWYKNVDEMFKKIIIVIKINGIMV